MARQGQCVSTFTHDGKRIYCYGSTPEEAKLNAVRKKALLDVGYKSYDASTTVSEWADIWLRSYKSGTVSDSWYRDMHSLIDNHIKPVIGSARITKVKPAEITRLMNRHADKSESFQKKLLLVLRQIFDSAEENEIIERNPTKRIKIAQRGKKQGYRTLTDEERSLTLRTAEKYPADGIFWLIMLYCGCRPQEVARLKMSDFDQEAKTLHVHSARKKDGTTGSTKTDAGNREIPVPDYLAERLYSLNKKPDEYIVTALNGSPLTESSQRKLWLRFRKNMDIENGAEIFRNAITKSTLADDLKPYCYRHTYCTDLQDAGVPVTVAKVLMGHTDIKMTADIYTHHSKESFEDARAKINQHSTKTRSSEICG